ncbi:MAG: hypothetical protein ACT4PV_15375 [Planctomycetaceae bacterium]
MSHQPRDKGRRPLGGAVNFTQFGYADNNSPKKYSQVKFDAKSGGTSVYTNTLNVNANGQATQNNITGVAGITNVAVSMYDTAEGERVTGPDNPVSPSTNQVKSCSVTSKSDGTTTETYQSAAPT